MKKLLIFDGKALSYRAFRTSKNSKIMTKSGHQVPMIYGFMETVLDFMGKYEPGSVMITLGQAEVPDASVESDPAYKLQYALLGVLIEALGIACIKADSSAGDVLKTLCAQAEKEEFKTYVVTDSQRALQLLTKRTHVIMLELQRDVHYNPNKFYMEYGLEAHVLPDFQALTGLGTAHGVPGIGEKTAKRIVGEYGPVRTLLQDMQAITDYKLRERIHLYREELLEGLEMAELKTIDALSPDFSYADFNGFAEPDHAVMNHFGLMGLIDRAGEDATSDLPLFEYME